MKLKTAKNLLLSACAIMVVLFFIGSATHNSSFIILGAIIAFMGVIFWIAFGRCPNCGKFLGRSCDKHCPHCGAEIEW